MAAASDLEALFAPHRVPKALSDLARFEEKIGTIWYADGFEISPGTGRSGISTWSPDHGFLDALFPFAMANGSGSIYALWNAGSSADVDEWPVIVFGDEGGVWVVARNLTDLLALLTFDAEPMIDHDGVEFYRDDKTHAFSEGHEDFIQWLRETFGIAPIDNADAQIQAAQTLLQAQFDRWKAKFVPA